jgi:hypothetical protein
MNSVGVGWLVAALAGLAVAVTARTQRGRLVPPAEPARPPAPTTAVTPPAPVAQTPPAPVIPTPPTLVVPVIPTPPTLVAPVRPAAAAAVALAAPPAAAVALAAPPVPAPPGAPPMPTASGDRVWRFAAGAAALVFAAVPAVRASGTLTVFCLLAAATLASYALVGGRTWGAVIGGGFALVPGVVQGAYWIATYRPRTARTARANPWRAILAIAVSVLLAAILIPLLRSADWAFANLLDSWTRNLPRADGRTFGGAFLLAFLGLGAAYFAHRGPWAVRSTVERNRPLSGLEWMIPILVVDLIFAVFVVVQINVLFAGNDYVLRKGGPDYADYARGGFGQLCFVTVLSLGLAAALGAWARRDTPRQRVMVRSVGGLLCALTLVIVASALKRMLLYVDAYGFTWPRLLGFSFEIWLGLVFLLVLAAGIPLRGRWLPRVTAATAAGVLLALAAANPEALMARSHIDARLNSPYPVDVAYVGGLSADAIDEILRLPPGARDCALVELRDELREPDPWYRFNLAREHARSVLAATPTAGGCDVRRGDG